MSNNTILYALYRLGYQDRMTGHGFRGLASTILNENGFEEAHIELQLAHMKRNKVAAAYNHAKYLKQRTAMMQWWADYLDAQLAKGRQTIDSWVLLGITKQLHSIHGLRKVIMLSHKIDTMVVSGGQAGLAISYYLSRERREHVVLERAPAVAGMARGAQASVQIASSRYPGEFKSDRERDAETTWFPMCDS